MTSKMDKFVLDPKSGYWGLSSLEGVDELRRHLETKRKPIKCYKGVQVVALNSTELCNLGCIYCSAKRSRPAKSMPVEVARKAIGGLEGLEDLPGIVFHGSEPLLNLSLIADTVAYGREWSEKHGKQISFSMQTNLTLLDERALDLIKNNQIGVSISLDGREEEHNLNRPYKGSRGPTYADVRRNMKRILELQKGLCAVCVVTNNNVDSLTDIALHFEDIGITEVHFLPAVDCSGEGGFRPSNESLTKSYIQLFDATFQRYREGTQRINVRTLMQYVSSLFLNTGFDACRMCTPSPGHPILGVDTDGSIYPCDFFWGDEEKAIGNVNTDSFVSLLNSPRNVRMRPIEETLCGDCDIRNLCGGGCYGDRTFSGGKPYYCETHKAVFEYLSRNSASLLEEGMIKHLFELEKKLK